MKDNEIFSSYLRWFNDIRERGEEFRSEDEEVFYKYFKYIIKIIKEYYDQDYFLDMLQEGLLMLYKYYRKFWSDNFDRSKIDKDVQIAEKKYILKMLRWNLYQYKFKVKFPIKLNNYTFNKYFNGAVQIDDIAIEDDGGYKDMSIEEQIDFILKYFDMLNI